MAIMTRLGLCLFLGSAWMAGTSLLARADIPADLEYSVQRPSKESTVEAEKRVVEDLFASKGFYDFKTEGPSGKGLSRFDGIYASADLKQVIFVEFGLEPTLEKYRNKIVEEDGESALLHGDTANGVHYAIYLNGFGSEQAKALSEQIKGTLSKKSKHAASLLKAIEDLLIPQAWAESPSDPDGCHAMDASYFTQIESLVIKDAGSIHSATFDCVTKALGGVQSGIQSIYNAWKQPNGGLWKAAKEEWGRSKNLASNLRQLGALVVEGWNNFPAELQMKVICHLAGRIAPEVAARMAASVLTGPALADLAPAYAISNDKLTAYLNELRITSSRCERAYLDRAIKRLTATAEESQAAEGAEAAAAGAAAGAAGKAASPKH